MRVGVCVGEFAPHVGGGYTFVSGVLDAFRKACVGSPHHFTVFCDPVAAQDLQASTESQQITYLGVRGRSIFDKAIAALKDYSPLFGLLYRRASQLERAALNAGTQLLWFVGGGVYDTPDIPYIATVWDLQHRTHPWFPEVSAKGRWDYREHTHRRFLRRAIHVITGTEVGAEQLRVYYQIPSERISVLPHPTPNIHQSNVKEPAALRTALSNRQFLFYPAQFWPHKNHVNLLYALKLLHVRYGQTIHLVFTGSDKGNLRHVESVVSQLSLAPFVHILGFVDRPILVWLYTKSNALVYPSFSGPENLPPLEANALGCPVVMSKYPGASEQMSDAAMYFDPYDPASMAHAIHSLLTDGDLRNGLVSKGYANAMARSADRYVSGVFSIIERLAPMRRSWP